MNAQLRIRVLHPSDHDIPVAVFSPLAGRLHDGTPLLTLVWALLKPERCVAGHSRENVPPL